MITVVGHSDLISNFNGDFRYLTIPDKNAQITANGLKKLAPVLVIASLCPYDFQGGSDRAYSPGEGWSRWFAFRTAAEQSNIFKVCLSPDDFDENEKEKIQLLLHLEGAHIIEKPEDLEQFVIAGGKALSLTWNPKNQYAGGAMSDGRLTPQGRELLQELKRRRVWLDLSHLNDQSFWDVMNEYDGPVFASHSNAQELSPSHRNLSRRQLHALRERRTWVGVSFARSHLTARSFSTIDDVIAHLEYLVDELGEDKVGLGTDYGGIISGSPKGLENVEYLPHLFEALRSRGWEDRQISNIAGANFLKFARDNG